MKVNKLVLFLIILAFLSACSSSDVKTTPHQVGDRASDFTLPDQDGNMVTLSEVLEDHRGVILAFYPKDDSKN
jgi:peroxiredoxin